MPAEIGRRPPEFQLPDTSRTIRSLKEFAGKKTVLAFFPGAFTGVCTKEMCTLRDSMQGLTSLGAQVVAISVNDPFSNKGFAEVNNLPFPILSDYTRGTVKKYDILQQDFAGLKGYNTAKRSIFILDDKGLVRFKWVSDDPGKEPDYEKIKKQLAKL
jgi:peroxiredoxin